MNKQKVAELRLVNLTKLTVDELTNLTSDQVKQLAAKIPNIQDLLNDFGYVEPKSVKRDQRLIASLSPQQFVPKVKPAAPTDDELEKYSSEDEHEEPNDVAEDETPAPKVKRSYTSRKSSTKPENIDAVKDV